MKKILLIILIHIVVFHAQGNSLDSISVLRVVDNKFIKILDGIVSHEKECAYYDADLIFTINILSVDSNNQQIQIGAVGNDLIEIGNESGCFQYKGHFFVVTGSFTDQLFCKSSQIKIIEFYHPKEEYNPKTGKVVLDAIENDTYSFWTYSYQDYNFSLLEKHTICE